MDETGRSGISRKSDGTIIIEMPLKLRPKEEYLPELKDKILRMFNDYGPVKDPKLREILDHVLVFLTLATSDMPEGK